jgi:hypothetical protein
MVVCVSVAVQTGFCKDRVVFLKGDGNRQVGKQTQRSTVVCDYLHAPHGGAACACNHHYSACSAWRPASVPESKNCHCHPRRSAPCCHWLAWGAPSCGLYPALPMPIPNLDSPAFTPALTFTAQPHTQITYDTATAPPGSHGHHSDCAHLPLAIVASPSAIRSSTLGLLSSRLFPGRHARSRCRHHHAYAHEPCQSLGRTPRTSTPPHLPRRNHCILRQHCKTLSRRNPPLIRSPGLCRSRLTSASGRQHRNTYKTTAAGLALSAPISLSDHYMEQATHGAPS